ncbi:uncharacterized protein HD556DRAFT_1311175 [Suillus plorans]|uniref:Uncharacterized protein n=1 Tax=Suillus plorans TaxID=116603 RepID=A0A9P7AJD8_9AGAM|nr:uncharacterized protein HD556DRAFT_1311175 [Suillus plorans]KAG1789581.1 hypothetical protein HD556DRAFT_1311175 [Suillus plorans]
MVLVLLRRRNRLVMVPGSLEVENIEFGHRELIKIPKSDSVNDTVKFYLSLVSYFKDVILAFHQEAKDDASSSTSKWRSAYLDYHIALALHNSAFTEAMQATALGEMKRTWAQFLEKKALKEVQQLTAKRMHDVFCSAGNNMCGGSFKHTMSDDETVSALLKSVTGDESAKPMNNADEDINNSMDSHNTPISMKGNSTMSRKLSEIVHDDAEASRSASSRTTRSMSKSSKPISSEIDVEDGDSAVSRNTRSISILSKQESLQIEEEAGESPSSQKIRSKPVLNNPKIHGRQKNSIIVNGGSKLKKQVVDTDHESPTDEIASQFEHNTNSKKNSKERRQKRKTRSSKALGKQKAAASPVVESEEDEEDATAVYPSVQPAVEEEDEMDGKESVEEKYDNVILPSVQDGWKDWTKVVFEDGNSKIFLTLATWMLIRFRQLTNIDMETPLGGLVIPENPRLLDDIQDDHFFEALGMERLYSALVHLETSPRYMTHIFHALGKVIANSDVSEGNPRMMPCNSPPSVEAQMMSDLDIPWLTLNNNLEEGPLPAFNNITDDDADGSIDGDEVEVRQALDSMMIDEGSTSVKPGTTSSDTIFVKRKRTLSQASPPKKEGGRGPAKRRKDSSRRIVRSPSPIPSATDIEDSGLISSPVVPQVSSNSNTSSPQGDASVLLQPWDEEMTDNDIDANGPRPDSFLSNEPHKNANLHDAAARDDDEEEIKDPTSPQAPSVSVLPPSPVILVPDTQPSQPQRSRDTTPLLPPIACIVTTEDNMIDESATPEASLAGGPTPGPEEDVAMSDTTPEDKCEIEVVPHDDSSVAMM